MIWAQMFGVVISLTISLSMQDDATDVLPTPQRAHYNAEVLKFLS